MQQVIRVYIAEVSYIFELSNLGNMKMKNNYKMIRHMFQRYTLANIFLYIRNLYAYSKHILSVMFCNVGNVPYKSGQVAFHIFFILLIHRNRGNIRTRYEINEHNVEMK